MAIQGTKRLANSGCDLLISGPLVFASWTAPRIRNKETRESVADVADGWPVDGLPGATQAAKTCREVTRRLPPSPAGRAKAKHYKKSPLPSRPLCQISPHPTTKLCGVSSGPAQLRILPLHIFIFTCRQRPPPQDSVIPPPCRPATPVGSYTNSSHHCIVRLSLSLAIAAWPKREYRGAKPPPTRAGPTHYTRLALPVWHSLRLSSPPPPLRKSSPLQCLPPCSTNHTEYRRRSSSAKAVHPSPAAFGLPGLGCRSILASQLFFFPETFHSAG